MVDLMDYYFMFPSRDMHVARARHMRSRGFGRLDFDVWDSFLCSHYSRPKVVVAVDDRVAYSCLEFLESVGVVRFELPINLRELGSSRYGVHGSSTRVNLHLSITLAGITFGRQ